MGTGTLFRRIWHSCHDQPDHTLLARFQRRPNLSHALHPLVHTHSCHDLYPYAPEQFFSNHQQYMQPS